MIGSLKINTNTTADFNTGHLGTTQVISSYFDVSTQADIPQKDLGYGSEENIKKNHSKNSRALYSKQDILEQYCISERGLGALENNRHSIFGCISSHQKSSCSNRESSFFMSSCIKQKIPSNEKLLNFCKGHPSGLASFSKQHRYSWATLTPNITNYNQYMESTHLQRKPYPDFNPYFWMQSGDEFIYMENSQPLLDVSYRENASYDLSSIHIGKKHVSFARSHTLTSFDDAMSSVRSSTLYLNRTPKNQERLLDVRKHELSQSITEPPGYYKSVFMDKLKRSSMKAQSTQTETDIASKPDSLKFSFNLGQNNLHEIKIISHQATVSENKSRKLTKSFSEAESQFAILSRNGRSPDQKLLPHDILQRTMSDEPPRTSFIVKAEVGYTEDVMEKKVNSGRLSCLESEDQESEDSGEIKKEIFIDFEPKVSSNSKKMPKKVVKTFSDGPYLAEQRKSEISECGFNPYIKFCSSLSHESMQTEQHNSYLYIEKDSSSKLPSTLVEKHVLPQHKSRLQEDTKIIDNGILGLKKDPLKTIDNKPLIKDDVIPEIQKNTKIQKFYLQEAPSPLLVLKLSESSPASKEAHLSTVIPDLFLTRTDSCKTNTDISESPTTDDYITANSGTDSSRKSNSFRVVPTFSPNKTYSSSDPTLLEGNILPHNCLLTPSEDSSSCGSYSIAGSTSDLHTRLFNELCCPEDSIEKRNVNVENQSCRQNYFITSHRFERDANPEKKDYLKTYKCGTTTKNSKLFKSKTKSTMQGLQKDIHEWKLSCNEEYHSDDTSYKTTSDESSPGTANVDDQVVMSNTKKAKEAYKRSLQRLPLYQKSKKGEWDPQTFSLPSSLSRRKLNNHSTFKHVKSSEDKIFSIMLEPECHQEVLLDYKKPKTLKALSTESLRSISPGSDSVFYSDPSNHAIDHEVHCFLCGKEVNHELHLSYKEKKQDIVQPPEVFKDCPNSKRFFKKVNKRIKSERRWHAESRQHKFKSAVRAKSEERVKDILFKKPLRPMACSPSCSQEQLGITNSSPSIFLKDPERYNDQDINKASNVTTNMLYVNENEMVCGLSVPLSSTEQTSIRKPSLSSIESKENLQKPFQESTHQMIQRKWFLEINNKQNAKVFFECEKTIVVQRQAGEFGFRIHGSKPVVVSAVEKYTPAEFSGLQVGDIILSINEINVLEKSHSEVVKIAHAGIDFLTMEVARICPDLNTPVKDQSDDNKHKQ